MVDERHLAAKLVELGLQMVALVGVTTEPQNLDILAQRRDLCRYEAIVDNRTRRRLDMALISP